MAQTTTCPRVVQCVDLLRRYREARGESKAELRRELLQYVNRGVYVDRKSTGAERSYRVLGIIEDKGDFYVQYSHNPTGDQMRMPLLRAVALIESSDPRYRLVYSDVA